MKSKKFLAPVFAASLATLAAASLSAAPPARADFWAEAYEDFDGRNDPLGEIKLERDDELGESIFRFATCSTSDCGNSVRFSYKEYLDEEPADLKSFVILGNGEQFDNVPTLYFKSTGGAPLADLRLTFKGEIPDLRSIKLHHAETINFDSSASVGSVDEPSSDRFQIFIDNNYVTDDIVNEGKIYTKGRFLLMEYGYNYVLKSFTNGGLISVSDVYPQGVLGVDGSNTIENFINDGTLESGNRVITVGDSSGGAALIKNLTNNGIIDSKGNALYLDYGSKVENFQNDGDITVGSSDTTPSHAILIANNSSIGTFINSGTIEEKGNAKGLNLNSEEAKGSALKLDGSEIEEFQNDGDIVSGSSESSSKTIWIENGSSIGTLTNNGTIVNKAESGSAPYSVYISYSEIDTIINTGTIERKYGWNAINIYRSDVGRIYNSGLIKAESVSIDISHTPIDEFINDEGGSIYGADIELVKISEDEFRPLKKFYNYGSIVGNKNSYALELIYGVLEDFRNEDAIQGSVLLKHIQIDEFQNSGIIGSTQDDIFQGNAALELVAKDNLIKKIKNDGTIQSVGTAIRTDRQGEVFEFQNDGTIKSVGSADDSAVNFRDGFTIGDFENGQDGTIESNGIAIKIEGGSSVGKLQNYGDIEASSGSAPAVYIDGESSISELQVSPKARFIVGDYVNQETSFSWVSDENGDSRESLQKIILAGDQDGVGDADQMSAALLGSTNEVVGEGVVENAANNGADFPALSTWQVGDAEATGESVVWEFGGKGGYADKDGITIDIVGGTARLTTSNGFDNGTNTFFETGTSKVDIQKNGTLDLNDQTDIEIKSLTLHGGTLQNSGIGEAILNSGVVVPVDSFIDVPNGQASLLLQSVIGGAGGLTKTGAGTTTLSGPNAYTGATTVSKGTLKLGSSGGVPRASDVTVKAGGTFDLNGQSPIIDDVALDGGAGSGRVKDILGSTAKIQGGALTGTITSSGGLLSGVSGADLKVVVDSEGKGGRTFIRDMASGTSLGAVTVTGGQLWAADDQTATVTNLTLETDSFPPDDRRNAGRTLTADVQDGLVLGFDDDEKAALKVTGTFTYTDGNVYLYKPAEAEAKDYEGTWKVMDFKEGDLSDAEYQKLFANTYLMYETPEGDLEYFGFNGDGSSADADLIREVTLKKGSLQVVVGGVDLEKPAPDGNTDGGTDGGSTGGGGTGGGSTGGGGTGGGSTGGGETLAEEIEDEIIDGILGDGDFDSSQNQDGDSTGDGGGTIDFDDGSLSEIAEGLEVWTRDELIEVVKRGLLPRNVDGAGQTLATYNNLLADTIFERTPMRQFTEVEPEVAVEPTPEPEVVPAGEPVRGLWAKSGAVNEAEANAYLDEQTSTPQPLVVADAHTAAEHQGEHLIEINGKTYAENDSLTAEYAERDGVRGWFRGFGGQSADSNGESGTLFNHYAISSGGGVVGVDVSLSESFQIGAYANYGNINLWQRNGVEGLSGSWEADGWGGGVTADYWTNNFYVQGLIGGTGFSGEQKRAVKGYANYFDDETASGEKSAGSMVGAVRVGAPFQSGSTYFEPQFTATWTGNSENRFSESADDDRLGLTYKSRNTNYLQTALGMKLAWPMKTGTTGLLTPSVKVAWLGDWNQNNADQRIGFDFTDKTYSVSSNQEDVNGALIKAGLDYSVAKMEGTTVKAYVRGGAEMWGGSRGTQWRASGGVTFQF